MIWQVLGIGCFLICAEFLAMPAFAGSVGIGSYLSSEQNGCIIKSPWETWISRFTPVGGPYIGWASNQSGSCYNTGNGSYYVVSGAPSWWTESWCDMTPVYSFDLTGMIPAGQTITSAEFKVKYALGAETRVAGIAGIVPYYEIVPAHIVDYTSCDDVPESNYLLDFASSTNPAMVLTRNINTAGGISGDMLTLEFNATGISYLNNVFSGNKLINLTFSNNAYSYPQFFDGSTDRVQDIASTSAQINITYGASTSTPTSTLADLPTISAPACCGNTDCIAAINTPVNQTNILIQWATDPATCAADFVSWDGQTIANFQNIGQVIDLGVIASGTHQLCVLVDGGHADAQLTSIIFDTLASSSPQCAGLLPASTSWCDRDVVCAGNATSTAWWSGAECAAKMAGCWLFAPTPNSLLYIGDNASTLHRVVPFAYFYNITDSITAAFSASTFATSSNNKIGIPMWSSRTQSYYIIPVITSSSVANTIGSANATIFRNIQAGIIWGLCALIILTILIFTVPKIL
jgi:hypothetical protein